VRLRSTAAQSPAATARAPHPDRPRVDCLRDTRFLLQSPAAIYREGAFADGWIDWPLQPSSHCCIATHCRLRLFPWRGLGGGVARGAVRYWRPWLTDFFGQGEGALAVITFLGISLVVAGVRAAAGCEVMAIPSLLFRKHSELACLIFSPLDSLERKLRRKRES
jgi:hypothetical protein